MVGVIDSAFTSVHLYDLNVFQEFAKVSTEKTGVSNTVLIFLAGSYLRDNRERLVRDGYF